MASLRDMVSEYQDDLRNGIAWLAFWREGRSWQAEAFHLDLDDTLYPEDRARLAEIQAADPRAVVVNGYYSGYLGEEMNVAELAAGVRHHYDNGLNNIATFMEAHSDELPPDVLEEAREKAHAAGLPFYERPYRGNDIDPYTYDGHMSIEDYELMQKLMEQDKERREPMTQPKSCKKPCGKSGSVPTIRRTFSCTTTEARRSARLNCPAIWCCPPMWTS